MVRGEARILPNRPVQSVATDLIVVKMRAAAWADTGSS